jgi:L-arabinose transport system permease protein
MKAAQTGTNGAFTRALGEFWRNSGMVVIFVVLFVCALVLVRNFANWNNMIGLGLSVVTIGLVSCTMMFCLAAGDFDLSVGSTVALAGVLSVIVTNNTNNAVLGVLAGVAVGAAVGLANGIVIAMVGINALITTLATMQIVRGAAYLVSDGKAVGARVEGFFTLGNSTLGELLGVQTASSETLMGRVLAIPTPILIVILFFVIFGVLLNKTTFGRNTLAIGGNKEASRLAGIPVARTKVLIFVLQGLVAGFAGVILASRFTSGQPKTSEGLELQVISACVLGGVSMAGGVASISGVLVGVLIMGTVQNVMNLREVQTFWQYVVSGAILLAAVMFDRLKQRRA